VDRLAALRDLIGNEVRQPGPKQAEDLVHTILDQRTGIRAILFYGSGYWREPQADTVFDFYVLIDSYREFDKRLSHALFGHLLPPNVYFLQTDDARCKYAVIRLDQFVRATAGQSIHSQIWARFAQPCCMLYASDVQVRTQVVAALAQAVITFHEQTLPLLSARDTTANAIWVRGLTQTLGNEWRSESSDRAQEIYCASREQFDARTELAVPLSRRGQTVVTTGFRRVIAKLVYFLQLTKAVFTFDGGVDYALYKIERQSGVRLEASDFQRRHPLLSAWPLVWKAWRAGALR